MHIIYTLLSFATTNNFMSEITSKTAPVGVLVLISQIATDHGIIIDSISAMSGVEFFKSTEN